MKPSIATEPRPADRDAAPNPAEPDFSNRRLLGWMLTFLRPVRRQAAWACVCLALWTGVEVLVVRETARTVNTVSSLRTDPLATRDGLWSWLAAGSPAAAALWQAAALLGGLTLTLAALSYLREVAAARLSMHLVYHIRAAVYDRLQRVGLAFHDLVSTGDLINRAFTDLNNIRMLITSGLLLSLEILLIVGGYIILLLTRSPWVALLALAPLPLWTWYIVRFSRRAQPSQKAVMEAGDANVSVLTENIAGAPVVKAFAAEQFEIDRYGRSCDVFFTRVMERIRLYANFTPVVRSISMASHLTLFLAAGILLLWQKLLPGDVLMLGAAMGAILSRLQNVAVINDQYQNAIVSARRLYEILAARPTVEPSPAAAPLPPGPGAVCFENVTFGYDAARPVLHDVSFAAPGGAVVALVGPTGAGKTTLVNLLARLYAPQSGRILIDGVDIRDATLDSLRREIAFVFQETYLFSDTVAGNIAYGRPETRGPRIEHAAHLAQAHEFIDELPGAYQAVLGERGATLSGGQRQRLAIARAILSDPRILILDDATAAVDPDTEREIRTGLREALRGRTTFVIAHRVSTVKQADVVIVLESGRVTAVGSHDALMQRDGHYRDVAAVQLYGENLAADESGEPASHAARVQQLVKPVAEPPPVKAAALVEPQPAPESEARR